MSLSTEYQVTFTSPCASDLIYRSQWSVKIFIFSVSCIVVTWNFLSCKPLLWVPPLPSVKSNPPAQRIAMGFTNTTILDRSQTSEPQGRSKLYVFLSSGLLSVCSVRTTSCCFYFTFLLMADRAVLINTQSSVSLSSQCPMFKSLLTGICQEWGLEIRLFTSRR